MWALYWPRGWWNRWRTVRVSTCMLQYIPRWLRPYRREYYYDAWRCVDWRVAWLYQFGNWSRECWYRVLTWLVRHDELDIEEGGLLTLWAVPRRWGIQVGEK
jgi:hypothetical protein